MTVEEIEIIVTARMEEVMKEVKKVEPQLKEMVKKVKESMENINTKQMTNKINQAVQFIKTKIADLKKSSKNNEIKLTVNNKDASKQVTQLEKEIDSLQKKINARQMKLNITNDTLDKIRADTNQAVIKEMPDAGNKKIKQETYNRLDNNTNYTSLISQSDKLNQEIIKYNALLESAKGKMSELRQETEQTGTSQNKLASFFSAFKSKLDQAKGSIGSLKNSFSQMPKITQNITNNIKGMGKSLKSGLGHILKYAGALFSLRGIYSVLSSSAQSWLSSQNAGAQQLSANIDYMKNAMGSALAPVIQFVTNLVYQLMKAIQSVVYALFRVNIFANASAKSMGSVAGNTKKATKEAKQLAGIHDEINNVQTQDDSNNNGGGSGGVAPSFDLSGVDYIQSNILDAIKNGDWYQVGALLGEKLNNALESIPWDKIQNTARNIATNIAQFLNGFIGTTDWNLVGNTFAQGLNTIIYFGYNFITTFDWKQFGKAIGDSINGFFKNVDWATVGKTLGEGIKGIFNTITGFFQNFDWSPIVDGLVDFLINIDWSGIVSSLFEALGSACASFVNLGMIIGEYINQAFDNIEQYFQSKIEECGGNIILGLLKGIVDGLIGIGEWIYNNMIYPFIEAFCNALGIHSPSTVFQEFGQNIIQGLFNGIQSLVDSITQIWNNIKQIAIDIFNNIKDTIVNIWNAIKTTITNIINSIKNTISNILTIIKSVWENVWNGIKSFVTNIWNGIKNIFSGVGNWFSNIFQQAYNGITRVFSNIGNFFSNIWNGIKNTFSNLGTSIGNAISGAVKNGINGVISLIQNTINGAIRLINGGINLINMIPGVNIGHVGYLSLPRLAKGGVLYEETPFIGGEYQGASNNPEIVTPQNIMYDTMRRAIEDAQFFDNNNGQPIYLTVNVGNKKLGQILLEDLRDRKRQTGKDIEALVGG